MLRRRLHGRRRLLAGPKVRTKRQSFIHRRIFFLHTRLCPCKIFSIARSLATSATLPFPTKNIGKKDSSSCRSAAVARIAGARSETATFTLTLLSLFSLSLYFFVKKKLQQPAGMQGKEGILAMEWKVLLIVFALESASQMLFLRNIAHTFGVFFSIPFNSGFSQLSSLCYGGCTTAVVGISMEERCNARRRKKSNKWFDVANSRPRKNYDNSHCDAWCFQFFFALIIS